MFYLTTEDLIKKGFKFSYCQGVKFWNKKESGNYKKRLNNKTVEFSKVFSKNDIKLNPDYIPDHSTLRISLRSFVRNVLPEVDKVYRLEVVVCQIKENDWIFIHS